LFEKIQRLTSSYAAQAKPYKALYGAPVIVTITNKKAASQAACWLSMTVRRSRSPAQVRGDAREDAYASIPHSPTCVPRLFACLDVETDALVDIARTPTAEPIISRQTFEGPAAATSQPATVAVGVRVERR
jgi:hypothetical protein